MKKVKQVCPACQVEKEFRPDQKTCGCRAKLADERSELTNNSWAISLPKTRIHTLAQLVEFFEIDLAIWEVERFIANKWEMGQAGGEAMPLFQVKAFLKKKQDIVNACAEIDALKALAKKGIGGVPVLRKMRAPTGNMLEINLVDHHYGKMAWAVETGAQNYDTKIADKVFWRAFSALLQRSSSLQYDEIWFVVGNDLFNSDDQEGRTTKGTYVSTDVRYQKTFGVVRTTMIRAIEELRKIAKVKVILVPGNHDHLTVWHLGDSLECYFHKYKDVEIDNAPRYRKYHSFGQVLIMYTHGDKGKRSDYPLLMATEQSELFGACKFREIHTGHNHINVVDEQHGVKVRRLNALCPPDAWHAEHGFVGNLRASEAFMWNKEQGLVGTAVYIDTDDMEDGKVPS